MSTVKPICVVYIPENFTMSGTKDAPMELMRALNGNFGYPSTSEHPVIYSDYWNQYYWFAFYDYEIQTPKI